ncbi:MAG: dolichyl-phosphate beta-glucosyltransferase [Thermodesulfovibrionales bacterium]
MKRNAQNNGKIMRHEPSLTPFLSIIIPAYNEEVRLQQTLVHVAEFVRSQNYGIEVLVVDNASTDRTREVILDYTSRHPFMHYHFEPKRGKGAAVRTGILAGRGEYLLICDADLAVPIQEIEKFLPPDAGDYDVAIGSREAKGARRYNEPQHRHLMGRVFNCIVRLLVLPGIQDTQCGFKCFSRRSARELFVAGTIDGWSFDVEILYIARLRGFTIVEVPINWYYGEESKISPLRDTWNMLREVIEIRTNGSKGTYVRK